MRLTPGTRLAQYEIIGRLGAGGMGEVYRAHDSRLGRDVAVKVLPERFVNDHEMRARFEHEARAVAAISHPNIIAIHELAVIDGQPVAVAELLEGESLREHLARGPLPWREVVQIGARIADGLAAAHAKGIVHRDLKPENVFLTADMRPKILDFGLARSEPMVVSAALSGTTFATEPGRVLGTIGYMAPEQLRGEPIGPGTDIFALGCTLSEMLMGERPFTRPTPADALAAVLNEPPPDLLAIGRDIPPRLAEVIGHCLEKDPARRFSSARDLAAALRALLSDSSSSQVAVPRRRGRVRALAVLPLASLEPDAEYLADGLTESIINSLSQLPKLRVVPRNTVFAYKGRPVSCRSVGLALNVDSLVTGRIVQQGGVLNIQAELVDVATETQVWGDQYRYGMSDLVALQEQIAWQISEALRMRLSAPARKRLHKPPTRNSDAYQDYLRGRHQWSRWTIDGFRQAIEHFEAAVAKDPSYARAYAGLADTYSVMGYYAYLPSELAMTRAAAAAYKAIDLDPKLAEAHAAIGICRMFYSWDWIGAEHALQKALRLDPRYPGGHMYHGLLLTALGRHDEALESARRGRELDPLSTLMQMGLAWALYFARRYDEALDVLREVTLVDPRFPDALRMLAIVSERLGQYDRAAETFAQAGQVFSLPLDSSTASGIKDALATGGAPAYWEARRLLADRLQEHTNSSGLPAYVRAVAEAQLGHLDAAFASLEQMIALRTGQAAFLMVDPALDPARRDPRWEHLLVRVGFPAVVAS